MTYGRWIRDAEASIGKAYDTLRVGRAADDKDIADTAVARSRVYLGLAALTELLANLPASRGMSQDDASTVMGKAPATAALLRGVLLAAAAAGEVVSDRQPVRVASRALRDAARSVSMAREVLLSHTPLRGAPLTPEGVAIRAGAGQEAALGDIGRLLQGMLQVDAAVHNWLSGAQHRPASQRLSKAAEWASTSNLALVAQELIVSGNHHPALLHGLNPPARPDVTARTPIKGADDAADRLAGICAWLYRNPGRSRAAHLAAGTRLGLTICLSAGAASARLSWTDASITASHLSGSPPDPEGQLVVEEMRQLARWIQHDVRTHGPAVHGSRQVSFDRLATTLPLFAEVLVRSMHRIVPRGEVFLRDGARLVKAPGQMIYHAVGTWRVANPSSEQVADLRKALLSAADMPPAQRTVNRVARRGFLPLSVAAQVQAASRVPSTQDARRQAAQLRR